MPDESCRKCGGSLIKYARCVECNKILFVMCKKCCSTALSNTHENCFRFKISSSTAWWLFIHCIYWIDIELLSKYNESSSGFLFWFFPSLFYDPPIQLFQDFSKVSGLLGQAVFYSYWGLRFAFFSLIVSSYKINCNPTKTKDTAVLNFMVTVFGMIDFSAEMSNIHAKTTITPIQIDVSPMIFGTLLLHIIIRVTISTIMQCHNDFEKSDISQDRYYRNL